MFKIYLGDGVYVERSDYTGDVVLTTENGIEETNRIVLEQDVIDDLFAWYVQHPISLAREQIKKNAQR